MIEIYLVELPKVFLLLLVHYNVNSGNSLTHYTAETNNYIRINDQGRLNTLKLVNEKLSNVADLSVWLTKRTILAPH